MSAEYCKERAAPVKPRLACQKEFWGHWGFLPWSSPPFEGVARGQHFVKQGLLGPLAEYRAWEAIVWSCGGKADREALWRSLSHKSDVFTQRFLFLLEEPWTERRIRSFWFGLRGYAEFFAWRPGLAGHEKARDLTGLVELALALESP